MTIVRGMIYSRDCKFTPGSITIEEEKIAEVNFLTMEELTAQEQSQYIIPGLVDVHSHFRDPGFTYKEDIETGAAAAAKG